MANDVGHDINYISLAGALHMIGEPGGPPVPPLNLLGDFGGGSMLLVVGLLAALVERATSGHGQVVDAAMIDGTALLLAPFVVGATSGGWGPRGTNVLDGGAHFYGAYECADGEYVSVAAMEPQFYAAFCERLGLADLDAAQQYDRDQWPALKERVAKIFATRTRAEWLAHMDGYEVCFAPVIPVREALDHPHIQARGTYIDIDGVEQPAPAPRFSRTAPDVPHAAHRAGIDTRDALRKWSLGADVIDAALDSGALAEA
jgi:alpha-methylacyl-CoA racemase